MALLSPKGERRLLWVTVFVVLLCVARWAGSGSKTLSSALPAVAEMQSAAAGLCAAAAAVVANVQPVATKEIPFFDEIGPDADDRGVKARCLCPSGIPSSQHKFGCTLLLEGCRVQPVGNMSFIIFVPTKAAGIKVAAVAKKCPVRLTTTAVMHKEVAARIVFRLRPEMFNSTASEATTEEVGSSQRYPFPWQSASHDVTLVHNVFCDDVMYHAFYEPGAFQVWSTREGVVRAIRQWQAMDLDDGRWLLQGKRVGNATMSLPLIPPERQLFSVPYRQHCKSQGGRSRFTELAHASLGNPTYHYGIDGAESHRITSTRYVAIGQWLSLHLFKREDPVVVSNATLYPGVFIRLQMYAAELRRAAVRMYGKPQSGGGSTPTSVTELFSRKGSLSTDGNTTSSAVIGKPETSAYIIKDVRDVFFDQKYQRWRGIRAQVEKPLLRTIEHGTGIHTVIPFDAKNMSLREQFHFINFHKGNVFVGGEGSFFSWIALAPESSTWIMLDDHHRSLDSVKNSMWHAWPALALCNVRLVVVEGWRSIFPPTSLWIKYIAPKLHEDFRGVVSVTKKPKSDPQAAWDVVVRPAECGVTAPKDWYADW